MKHYFWTLCVFSTLSIAEQVSFEVFQTPTSSFEIGSEKEQAAIQSFTPPQGFKETVETPQPFEDSTNLGVLSAIDSTMSAGTLDVSKGETFFNKGHTITGDKEVDLDLDNSYVQPVVRELTSEDIMGSKIDSVEDILSSRGFPVVKSTTTSLDFLGLPKPDLSAYETPNKVREIIVQEKEEKKKERVHYTEFFNK